MYESGTTIVPIMATTAAAAPMIKTTSLKTGYVPTGTYEPKKPDYTWLWWLLGLVVVVLIGIGIYSIWKRNQNIKNTLATAKNDIKDAANTTRNQIKSDVNSAKQNVSNQTQQNQQQRQQNQQQRQQQVQQKVQQNMQQNQQQRQQQIQQNQQQRQQQIQQNQQQRQQSIQNLQQGPQQGSQQGSRQKQMIIDKSQYNSDHPQSIQFGIQELEVIGDTNSCNGNGFESSPSSAIQPARGGYVNKDGSSFGGASAISSKTSSVKDDDLFSFFGDSDAPTPTPGQGMPASFVQGGSSKWRAVPIGPLDEQGRPGSDPFDPDCDDALMLPPTITLDQQRKAIQRESAMRSLSSRKGGKNKNMGQQGLWQMINPSPDRVGNNKPTGNIAFGITDSYWSASACNNTNPSEIENQFLAPPKTTASPFGQINTEQNPMMNFGGQSMGPSGMGGMPGGMLSGGISGGGMPSGGMSGGGKASYPTNLQQVASITRGLESNSGRIASGLGDSEW